ncbi:UPF0223 family protein [Limosilactobacillus caecicola]|uniref:UPF0223 family protein n=1 Tax=Limosilactobacillus caecicola TaxID=2941332 RepID=UPI002040EC22|nr:UPF0223 family protein [Limosilactobacillus caecicola]
MDGNYSYPIDPSWTTGEIVMVVHMFNLVEKAYEQGAMRDELLKAYHDFKHVVPAKSEEKRLGRDFYQKSGYQLYDVIQATHQSQNKIIRLGRG